MSDRDDAPPGEAVEAITQLHHGARVGIPYPGAEADALSRLAALRTLPDAARWRLIGWLAAGLEPTREMVRAALDEHFENGPDGIVVAALAAAREAGDGS